MVIFINAFSNKSKATGKPFTMVTLYELIENDLKNAKKREFFTNSPLPDMDKLNFGDIVKCGFTESPYLGGQPILSSLTVIEESQY